MQPQSSRQVPTDVYSSVRLSEKSKNREQKHEQTFPDPEILIRVLPYSSSVGWRLLFRRSPLGSPRQCQQTRTIPEIDLPIQRRKNREFFHCFEGQIPRPTKKVKNKPEKCQSHRPRPLSAPRPRIPV
ncbi:hypothetical protein TSAR_009845 [Trichomalopsis sarcophagae]|uniref:Uncharacterized protein n=1 Tax=Trichomalopsis sarcophagae TaxID=543379 RepID=A0A232EPP4_9HYME|nr:hypothetical protein TSAR_009845 [Trichomalopsis sarcophagae]